MSMVLTALLTTGVGRVARGMSGCASLVKEILTLDHRDLETTLWLGDEQFYVTKDGPYPNNQMRVSARPTAGYAALNYTDHDNPESSNVNSYNPAGAPAGVHLIFNGDIESVFPQSALILIADAEVALLEWLRTRSLPTSIEWRPIEEH